MRTFDSAVINRVANHPAVFPGTLSQVPVDISEIIKKPQNVCLVEDRGGFFLDYKGNGTYEVHAQFLPTVSALEVRRAALEAIRYMFERTDCELILGFCVDENPTTIFCLRACGFVPLRRVTVVGHPATEYGFSRRMWRCQ